MGLHPAPRSLSVHPFPEFQPVLTRSLSSSCLPLRGWNSPETQAAVSSASVSFHTRECGRPRGFIAVLLETVCSALSPVEGFQSLLGGKHFHGFRIIRLT